MGILVSTCVCLTVYHGAHGCPWSKSDLKSHYDLVIVLPLYHLNWRLTRARRVVIRPMIKVEQGSIVKLTLNDVFIENNPYDISIGQRLQDTFIS